MVRRAGGRPLTPPTRQYEHPTAGFTIPLPEEWEPLADIDGVALIAVEPARGSQWFRTNLVVTIEPLDIGADLAGWQEQALALMRYGLHEFQLVDVEDIELAGLPARRTLIHHRTEAGPMAAAVAMEQWTLIVGRLGYTITASMAALEYDELADVFAGLVAGFRPDPGFQL